MSDRTNEADVRGTEKWSGLDKGGAAEVGRIDGGCEGDATGVDRRRAFDGYPDDGANSKAGPLDAQDSAKKQI